MKSAGFHSLSIRKILKDYQKKKLSPVDIAKICIDRVEEFEPLCQAWVCFNPGKLLEEANLAEMEISRGGEIKALLGIPVGIKDIFNTIDFPTEMGSPIWKNFTPGNDSRTVFNVKQAGGIVPGKTVTAEFAVHTLGKTLNPHDKTRNPGTSSSGSAVGVASGMIPVALGTQTAGSIVRPASFCGVYGCKPSFGLIPRTGMLKTTDSLDTVGFFTAHYEDLQGVFEVLRVHGPDYPVSDAVLNDGKRQHKPAGRPWRVLLMKTHVWKHVPDYAKESFLGWMKKLGKLRDIEVIEADLPKGLERSHEIHMKIYDRALAYYFAEEFKRAELVSPIMNEIIRRGNAETVEEYHQALIDQDEIALKMDDFMKNYDILISLSTAGSAPLRDETEEPDPALIWTMTHLPVISSPVFKSPDGLPFGLQISARRYNDYLLFRFADFLRAENMIPSGANPLAFDGK